MTKRRDNGITDEQLRNLAIAAATEAVTDAFDTAFAMERAAQILDFVVTYNFLLPHNDEVDRLLLEHVQWVDKKRAAGRLPPAKTIKRPVAKPKATKRSVLGESIRPSNGSRRDDARFCKEYIGKHIRPTGKHPALGAGYKGKRK